MVEVQIDPEHPALPLSYPASFAVYLAKRFGKYGSFGLLEDTDSLNAEVLDEAAGPVLALAEADA